VVHKKAILDYMKVTVVRMKATLGCMKATLVHTMVILVRIMVILDTVSFVSILPSCHQFVYTMQTILKLHSLDLVSSTCSIISNCYTHCVNHTMYKKYQTCFFDNTDPAFHIGKLFI
jgi:hypothetical protein